jgi:NarL family two-component system response regulator LiaR
LIHCFGSRQDATSTVNLGVSNSRGNVRPVDAQAGLGPVEVAVATRPALVRDVLARALGTRLGLRVVSFADAAGADAPRRLLELEPRILLIDDLVSPIEAVIRRLHRASPSTRILVLHTRSDEVAPGRFAPAGAYAVIQNRSDLAALVRAVEAASQGKACESVRDSGKRLPVLGRKVVTPSGDPRLTTREWEVAALVAKGLRNKGIALRLNISVDTVKSHLNNSFRKLKVDSRLALAILAQGRLGPKTDM